MVISLELESNWQAFKEVELTALLERAVKHFYDDRCQIVSIISPELI